MFKLKKFNQICEDILLNSPNIYYHISPFKFDKFELSKCGSGMETSFWGYGIYFSKDENTIEYYFNQMKDSYQNLFKYTVEISGNIKNEFDKIKINDEEITIGELYYNLVEESNEKNASEKMKNEYNIDGISYYTQEDGNSLVVYNDEIIKIINVKSLL